MNERSRFSLLHEAADVVLIISWNQRATVQHGSRNESESNSSEEYNNNIKKITRPINDSYIVNYINRVPYLLCIGAANAEQNGRNKPGKITRLDFV